jgi:mono/diheme cytochrome c family protein
VAGVLRAARTPCSPMGRSMKSHPSFVVSFWLGLVLAPGIPGRADEPPALPADHARRMKEGLALFQQKIRPALIQSCLECHGGKKIKGGFDLSDRKPLLESGVIDGSGKESYLYALITHAEEPHMPQKGQKLSAETADEIARWIDLGAPYDRPLVERAGAAPARAATFSDEERNFWSFRPIAAVAPPDVSQGGWAQTPIDRFILASLDARGLKPNPAADRRVLIRRVSFDLVGLPPTVEEVESFVADAAPDAYERLVDRLLASPRYGERWARHWMDVARFAESHGYEQDYDRKLAFHYRDFLIRALNQNMPFDQFARWQIAGDELAPDDPLALAATGFLGAGAFPTQLTEMEFESARYDELSDMTGTTGVAFLGLSVGCARCHDHKYDPISSEDYYRLAATFTTTIRSEIDVPYGPDGAAAKMQVTSEGFPHTKHHADDRGFPHFYPKTYVLARGDVNQRKREATPGSSAS